MKTAKDLELLLLIKEHEKQKLQLRINQAIEYINIIKEEWNNKAVPEKNLYMFQTYLNGIDKLIYLLNILEGEDDEVRN